ncbi:hypothetical protein LB504_003585 [Fusarium proliferatum]|nr:hypothetical protein LB504_003585 [Fusarium proliferatum]
MLPMYHYPPPAEDPEMKAACLQAIMRDDLMDHCRRPSFNIYNSQKTIGDLIVQIVKDARQKIRVPQTGCKRRMSVCAVLM